MVSPSLSTIIMFMFEFVSVFLSSICFQFCRGCNWLLLLYLLKMDASPSFNLIFIFYLYLFFLTCVAISSLLFMKVNLTSVFLHIFNIHKRVATIIALFQRSWKCFIKKMWLFTETRKEAKKAPERVSTLGDAALNLIIIPDHLLLDPLLLHSSYLHIWLH